MRAASRRISGLIPLIALAALATSPATVHGTDVGPALTPLWTSDRPAMHLSFDNVGRLWVATPDSTFDIYDRDGSLLETWGTFGRGAGQFDLKAAAGYKGGVAFRPDGGFYVADADNARVQEFDADRDFVREWGSFGTGDEQFIAPDSIALDAAGLIYVNETGGDRGWIHVFDGDGTQVRLIREDFQGPFFALDPDGTAYVIDEMAKHLVAVRPDGTATTIADLAGLISFGTGVLHLADGGAIVASETDIAPEHLIRVGADGTVLGMWPNGGEYMALDPTGDRFYISTNAPGTLSAYALPVVED
jgi:hypothetical protein